MREIDVNDIVKAVSKLCIEANCVLNSDVYEAIERAKESEESPVGREILGQLTDNAIYSASRITAIQPKDGTDPLKIQPKRKPKTGPTR